MANSIKETILNKVASNKTFIIALSVGTIVYAVVFNIILTTSEVSQIGMLGYIPVILFAWKYGLKRGIIAAVFILLGTSLNFTFFAPPSVTVSPLESIIGAFSHFLLAAMFGTLGELIKKLKHEITIRQKTEAELQKYQQHLEELVRERTAELEQAHENLRQSEKMEALGQLTGGIVHDFNNMLGGIIGYADLIKRKYAKNDPTLEKYTKMIFETSERAAELIAKLLTFSRKEDFQVEPLCIHDLITNTIKLLEHSIDKKIEISEDLNADLSIVIGDYAQLQNVMINLAVNARDAMPEGGELTFSTEVKIVDKKYTSHHLLKLTPGPYMMISVTDTGTGIDDKTRKKIFEPFFTTKEKGKGTGMGLASAYGTIKNHSGSIEVYSKVGKGTTFKIYLPCANEDDTEVTKTGTFIGKQSGSVLLIDDEETMRFVGSEMLSDLGFTVSTCEDGRQGIEYYKKHHKEIDYIILDIMMPNLDGFSCLREMRKINKEICVIVSSGYTINSLAKDLIKEGARGFIQKPFDALMLVKAIAKAKLSRTIDMNPGQLNNVDKKSGL